MKHIAYSFYPHQQVQSFYFIYSKQHEMNAYVI